MLNQTNSLSPAKPETEYSHALARCMAGNPEVLQISSGEARTPEQASNAQRILAQVEAAGLPPLATLFLSEASPGTNDILVAGAGHSLGSSCSFESPALVLTPQELARQLNGLQYPVRLPKALVRVAKTSGLVVVYGASDDLMEFDGVIQDELGVFGGGVVHLDSKGVKPVFDDIDPSDKAALRDYFEREHSVSTSIQALWCAEPGYSWTYKTGIPHATFEVVEDGEPYCRGLVFAVSDIAPAAV